MVASRLQTTRGCESQTLDDPSSATVLWAAASDARLATPGPRLRGQRQESCRQVVHLSLRTRQLAGLDVKANCVDQVSKHVYLPTANKAIGGFFNERTRCCNDPRDRQ